MKILSLIFLMFLSQVCMAQNDSIRVDSLTKQELRRVVREATTQAVTDQTTIQIDKNSKAVALLMTAVPALTTLLVALLIYIKKNHSYQLKTIVELTKNSTEALTKVSLTSDKLSTSIDTSGEKISVALNENRRAVDLVRDLIISNRKNE